MHIKLKSAIAKKNVLSCRYFLDYCLHEIKKKNRHLESTSLLLSDLLLTNSKWIDLSLKICFSIEKTLIGVLSPLLFQTKQIKSSLTKKQQQYNTIYIFLDLRFSLQAKQADRGTPTHSQTCYSFHIFQIQSCHRFVLTSI